MRNSTESSRVLTGPAWSDLLARLRGMPELTIGYSGGIDSRLLAHAAWLAGVHADLVHIRGPHVAPAESRFALDWARKRGLPLRVLRLDPTDLPEVAEGGRDRCLACKRHLFSRVKDGVSWPVCDGSNASDLALHRPGRLALRELGVVSPLAEVGLTKDRIRGLARALGLERPDQPSRACLLTRLPYGLAPTSDLLTCLARGEEGVENALSRTGMPDLPFRLRMPDSGRFELHLGLDTVPEHLMRALEPALLAAGFACTPILAVPELSGYYDALERVSMP